MKFLLHICFFSICLLFIGNSNLYASSRYYDDDGEDTLTFLPKAIVNDTMNTVSGIEQKSNVWELDTNTFYLSDSGIIFKYDSLFIVDTFSGTASYYGDQFHGRRTSCGEVYCRDSLTAAHRTLPFGTLLRIINRYNGNCVVVRVNDRGPFVGERCVDVSRRAAEILGMMQKGTVRVNVEIIAKEKAVEKVEPSTTDTD